MISIQGKTMSDTSIWVEKGMKVSTNTGETHKVKKYQHSLPLHSNKIDVELDDGKWYKMSDLSPVDDEVESEDRLSELIMILNQHQRGFTKKQAKAYDRFINDFFEKDESVETVSFTSGQWEEIENARKELEKPKEQIVTYYMHHEGKTPGALNVLRDFYKGSEADLEIAAENLRRRFYEVGFNITFDENNEITNIEFID